MTVRRTWRSKIWGRVGWLLRVAFVVALLGLAVLLRIASHGMPESWVERLSAALSGGSYRIDLEDVTFTLRRGVGVGRVRVAPEAPGALPILTLDRATVRFSWRLGEPLRHWVRSIEVERAVLAALPAKNGDRARLPDFGPLHVRCGFAEILGTAFYDVTAVVVARGDRLDVERARADLAPPRFPMEIMEGDFSFHFADRAVTGAASGSLNVRRLAPLLRVTGPDDLSDILERFEFPAEPATARIRLDYAPAARRRQLEAVLAAAACVYQGVPLMAARATLVAEGRDAWDVLHVRELAVERPEGSGRGVLEFDFAERGLRFAVRSTLDPRHLRALIGIFEDDAPNTWQFGAPTLVAAEGFHAWRDSRRPTDIVGSVRAPTLTVDRLRFENVEALFRVQPDRVTFPSFTGTLFGGACAFTGSVQRALSGERVFSVSGNLQGARTGAIFETFAGRGGEDPGTFETRLSLSGNLSTNTLRSLRGEGRTRIRRAQLYRLPLFAGLTDFLVRNVPGVDFVVSQNDLDAEFTIEDLGLHLRGLRIEGSVFSIAGEGSYWLTDNLDLSMRIHLLRQRTLVGRILRVALFPVSKLFEKEVRGPLAAPVWTSTTLRLRGRRGITDAQRDALPAEGAP